MMNDRFTRPALILSGLLLALVLSACGTPTVMIAGNMHDVTALPVLVAAQPTSIATTKSMADMAGMATSAPVTVLPVTHTASDGPTATELVVIYVLFGTPTQTANVPGAASQPVTVTVGNTASVTPGASAVPATLAPTHAATVLAATAASTQSTQTTTTSGTGDVASGKNIFAGVAACSACHDMQAGIVLVGPSLKGVATRAESREPGKSAADYLHESIVAPNAFVVKGFQPGIMPQNFGQSLSAQQVNDVVAYLLTLK